MSDRTTNPALRDALARLARGQGIDEAGAAAAFGEVMEGGAPPQLVAALLMGLRARGETVDEIVGAARAIRERALPFPVPGAGLVDTCGTGGDGAGTFNISTAAAFVAAGGGARVAKHGNRAVSGRTGSADVLEALGVEVGLNGPEAAAALDHAGITFLFAPTFHAAMRHAGPVRRELGVRTVFNLLGPLCNPAGARAQLIGVFDGELVAPLAAALGRLGASRALVVHGRDGLDELSVCAPTRVAEWDGERVREYEVEPESLGLRLRDPAELRGGDAATNAAILRAILGGEAGAPRDVVVLNAAAALLAAGIADDLDEGLERARASIDTGAARARLDALVAFGRERAAARRQPVVEQPVAASNAGWAR